MDSRFLRPGLLAVTIALSVGGGWLWLGPVKHEPDRRVVSLAVSTSGKWFAAGTAQGWITVWNRQNPRDSQHLHASQGALNDLQISPDERTLAVANLHLALHAVEGFGTLHTIASDDRNYGTVRFSPDGRRLLAVNGTATIETVDIDSGSRQLKICCTTNAGEVSFSPDGTIIANAGHWPALWDAQTGTLIRRLTREREFLTFRPIAFDERRGAVAMGSQDGRVYGWDVQTGAMKWSSPASPGYVETIAILKSTGWIAYAKIGGPLRLWNPDTQEQRFLPEANPTSGLVADADGNSILFGTESGWIEIWDTRNLSKQMIHVPTR